MNFSQLAVVPAIADNAMLCRGKAGQIVGLGGAGDRREGRLDPAERATLPKSIEARRIRSEQRFGQPDDVDHSGAFHDASRFKPFNAAMLRAWLTNGEPPVRGWLPPRGARSFRALQILNQSRAAA